MAQKIRPMPCKVYYVDKHRATVQTTHPLSMWAPNRSKDKCNKGYARTLAL